MALYFKKNPITFPLFISPLFLYPGLVSCNNGLKILSTSLFCLFDFFPFIIADFYFVFFSSYIYYNYSVKGDKKKQKQKKTKNKNKTKQNKTKQNKKTPVQAQSTHTLCVLRFIYLFIFFGGGVFCVCFFSL